MACTPEIKNLNKNVGSISSGINRSLLTPCRRVGLSRKRKTPNSLVKIYSDDLNKTTSVNDRSFVETTPTNYKKPVRRKNDINFNTSLSEDIQASINENETKINDNEFRDSFDKNNKNREKKSKKDLFWSFSNDLFDCGDSTLIKRDNAESSKNSTAFITEISKEKLFTSQSKDSSNFTNCVNILEEDQMKSMNVDLPVVTNMRTSGNLRNKTKENDFDEDFKKINPKQNHQTKKENRETKSKKLKKNLSLKKSLSVFDDEFDSVYVNSTSDKYKECKINLQRIRDDEGLNNKRVHENCDKSVVIDEEDDDFRLTPEQEKVKKEDMLEKIKNIEKSIRQKRHKLADLNRASIYKNKHKIEDIKQLTSKWTAGCVLSLNDLLNQLQAHGPMNMATLLSNLHIPDYIIAKLSINIIE